MKMNHVLNQYLEFLIKKSPFFLSILYSFRAIFWFDQYQWFPGILSWIIYWIESTPILFELNNSLNRFLGKQYWIKYWIESFLAKFKHWIESDRVSQRARTRFKLSSLELRNERCYRMKFAQLSKTLHLHQCFTLIKHNSI